ncbi:lipin Ned1, partial [Exophiala xenobiotica]
RPIPQIRRHGTNLSDQLQSLPNSKTDLSGITPPDRALTAPLTLARSASEELLPVATRQELDSVSDSFLTNGILLPPKFNLDGSTTPKAPGSPPSLRPKEAYDRAMTLSKKLSISNIRSQVTESGDLMLDMTGYKSSEDEALRAEAVARKLLSEELEGNYDIGSLIGTDENGNLWIYSSEEARDAALQKAAGSMLEGAPPISMDNASDPGYHSDSDRSASPEILGKASSLGHQRAQSEEITPSAPMSVDPGRNFAKTLRLTSDQLKALNLKSGRNQISFTVNRATCTAYMYYWTSDVPIVISDIDGTITKSDALGHLLNMVGRDWTHAGVAKLYSDIVANGYNILYLTSRSVGQADTTRAYLNGIVQDGWRLPEGPVILSPDRTIAALRREVYLRKPEVFKMAYLLTLNKYRSSYVTMREVVDHFFPPVSTLVKEGGEDYTDFTYWRDLPQDLDNFTPTDSEAEEDEESDEEEEEEEAEVESDNELGDSFMSRDSLEDSIMSESIRQSIEIDNTAEALEESRLDDDGDDEREADFADDYLGGDDAQRRKASQTPTPRSPRR